MARRHAGDNTRSEQSAVLCMLMATCGPIRAPVSLWRKPMCRASQFPAPATVETWVSYAAGDPLLVVMADPAASLAAELRRFDPRPAGDSRRRG